MTEFKKLQEELGDLKAEVEKLQSKKGKRDLWDKLSSATPLITGVLITGLGTIATCNYNDRQQDMQHKLQRIEALDKNMKYLISEDPRQRQFGYINFSTLGFQAEALQIIGMSKDSVGGINFVLNVAQNTKDTTLRAEANKTILSLITATTPLGTRVKYTADDKGQIQFDGFDELVTELVPQLKGKPSSRSDTTFNGYVTFNVAAIDDLKAAFAEIEEMGLLPLIKTWDGSMEYRLIRGHKQLSNHAIGLAFDINYEWNHVGVPPPSKGKKGSVTDLVPIFKKYGFFWHGDDAEPYGACFYWRKHK